MYLENQHVLTVQCDGDHSFSLRRLFPRPVTITTTGEGIGECQRKARNVGWVIGHKDAPHKCPKCSGMSGDTRRIDRMKRAERAAKIERSRMETG